MDIVTLKSHSSSRKRSSERRHTTDVTLDQLPSRNQHPLSVSIETTPAENMTSTGFPPHLGDNMSELKRSSLSSSWSTLFRAGISDFETCSESPDSVFVEGSQPDYDDVMQMPAPLHPTSHLLEARHGYQLSYELALDNVLTPIANSQPTSPRIMKPLSPVTHVIQEMVTTEQTYVRDLSAIIEGYFVPMETKVGILPLQPHHMMDLFSNLEAIRNFNQSLLEALQGCGHSARRVGQCFLNKAEGFKIYTQYCTNYPTSVTVLAKLSKDPTMSVFLKECQQRLKHMLPLGAYLLKPVQRVLKYSLLLKYMAKHMKTKEAGYPTVHKALERMTEVAEHINAMKKKYDTAVHVQEVQSLIRGWEGIDLMKHGDLVLEENFRYYGGKTTGPTFRTRTDRYLFLFQQLLLMTKKEEDGFQYKAHFEMKDIQLTERIEKEPSSFQIRQVSTGRFYTFQARSQEVKEQWVRTIKVLLMESIPHLPDKAKLLILAGFPTDLTEVGKRSPTRHRHSSEELSRTLPAKRGGWLYAKTEGTRTASQQKGKTRGNRKRSSTTPDIRVSSPTHSLIKASFTGYVAATVHTPHEMDEIGSDEDKVELEHATHNGNHVPSPHLHGDSYKTLEGSVGSNGHVPVSSIAEEEEEEPYHTAQITDTGIHDFRGNDKDFYDLHRKGPFFRGSIYSSSRSTSGSPEPMGFELSKKHSSSLDELTVTVRSSPLAVQDTEAIRPESVEYSLESNGDDLHAVQRVHGPCEGEGLPNVEDRFAEVANLHSSDDESAPQPQQQVTSVMLTVSVPPQPVYKDDPRPIDEEGEIQPSVAEPNVLQPNHITDEEEQLFCELMKSESSGRDVHQTNDTTCHDVYPTSDSSCTREAYGEHPSRSEVEPSTHLVPSDQDETPKASPSSIRRWAIDKQAYATNAPVMVKPKDDHQAYDITAPHSVKAEEDSHTPMASPAVVSKHSTSTKWTLSSCSSAEDISRIVEPPSPFQDKEPDSLQPSSSPVVGGDESPVASPVHKHLLKVKSSAIVRRHSYNEQFTRRFRNRDGTRSTGNSPSATLKAQVMEHGHKAATLPDSYQQEKYQTQTALKRRSSFSHEADIRSRPISMLGLVSTTRSDLSLEDLMTIVQDENSVPPPSEMQYQENQPDELVAGVPSSPDAVPTVSASDENSSPRSKFRLARHRKAKSPLASAAYTEDIPTSDLEGPQATEWPVSHKPPQDIHELEENPQASLLPYEGNPEERLTFDEILSGFDQYASATGKTTRSRDKHHKGSPEPGQVKKKSRKWRRKTVATVDADTMKDVRDYMSAEKEDSPRGSSKVQQLARHYSRLIKEHQQARALKRHSTVIEPSDAAEALEDEELVRLGDSRRDGETSTGAVAGATPQADRATLSADSSQTRKIIKRTKSFSLPRVVREDEQEPPVESQAQRQPGDLMELQRRGRFKGWVKSLVEKFSNNSKDK